MRERNFLAARRGNVALMFGLMLFPLLMGAGIALDMLRANHARGVLAEAADSGVLAAARSKVLDGTITDAEATAIARKYFDANSLNLSGIEIMSFDFVHDLDGELFQLTVDGRIKTSILSVGGFDYSPLDLYSEAKIAPPRALEVVLVLDNTGSMSGQKIQDLRDSASDLVGEIMADTDNEVLVGIVPFSTHVNMGMSRGSEPWLDVPADSSYDSTSCPVDAAAATSAGCTSSSTTCYSDGEPYSCDTWTCPGGASPPTTCTTTTIANSWQGCVGSRDYPRNIKDEQFAVYLVPGVLNNTGAGGDCPGEITPMTIDKTKVLDEIGAMTATGNTYIPGGLTWGLRLISAEDPFIEGKTYQEIEDAGGLKAIVLMTDGQNTKSPNSSNGAHYSTDTDQANDYTIELCDEIKSEGIILYTIAFDISDPDLQDMIEDCATNPEAFFDAGSATELSEAFGTIGNSLTELALTR